MATYWENSCSFGLRYVLWCEYLIVSLGFSHLGFWSGSLFLIAPFPDLCLLVPFYKTSPCHLRALALFVLSRWLWRDNRCGNTSSFHFCSVFNDQYSWFTTAMQWAHSINAASYSLELYGRRTTDPGLT